ncbi:hypothetical protein ZWY2020_011739 [Hordeum vulgare]|nr:hypothetical protein ZWY2020_011739 [Hordeum vulgare]
MAHRGRAKIQWISNDVKRKEALRRLPSLAKKARDLAILYNIQICLLVCVPGEARPVLEWSSPEEATRLLQRYGNMLDSKKLKNKVDAVGIIQKMIIKAKARILKDYQKNHDLKNNFLLSYLCGGHQSFGDIPLYILHALGQRVEMQLKAVNARLEELRSVSAQVWPPPQQQDVSLAMLPPPITPVEFIHVVPTTEVMSMNDHRYGATTSSNGVKSSFVVQVPKNVQMVDSLPMTLQPPSMVDSLPNPAFDTPMTQDVDPLHGSYLFEVVHAYNGHNVAI